MNNDPGNMRQILNAFPQQCEDALTLGNNIVVDSGVKDITLAGIGGSGIAGDILKCLLWNERDVFVSKNYSIPHFISPHSLVFLASHSGNTEETLEAGKRALSRGAQIVGIGKGGRLETFCEEHACPFIRIPEQYPNMQPRCAAGFMTLPLLNVLQQSDLAPVNAQAVKNLIADLKTTLWEERGRELAEKLNDKTVVVYTSEEFYCIGLGWTKQRLNETAKMPAFYNTFPELSHNEISAYQTPREDIHTIFFMDNEHGGRTRRRMELVFDMLPHRQTTAISLKGSPLSSIFTSLHLGDWTAYHIAILRGVDPTAVPLQEHIKRIMQNNVL